jgi:hypothetical protein
MWVFSHASGGASRIALAFLALGLLLVAPAGPARAYGYSPLNPPSSGEDSHLQILDTIYAGYGGSFVADGLGFTNATAGVTLKRVYDFDTGVETLDLFTGDETGVDQIWTDGSTSVTAQAKFAGYVQSFGWNQGEGVDGLDITNYYELLTDANIGGLPVEVEITGDFLWASQANGFEWWSMDSLNPDGADHLLTYFVEGLPDAAGAAVWLLFWEDSDAGSTGYDGDHNDFVVELRVIPEPGTLCLVAAGLAGLAVFGRRRRTP